MDDNVTAIDALLNGLLVVFLFIIVPKTYNNIFYYFRVPLGELELYKGTLKLSKHAIVLTPRDSCPNREFRFFWKRPILRSKRGCFWINLSKIKHTFIEVQYSPKSNKKSDRYFSHSPDDIYGLFILEGNDYRGSGYYILRDSNNVLHLTDWYNYPEDKDEYTLVASMLSRNTYTLGQLRELDRTREGLYIEAVAD